MTTTTDVASNASKAPLVLMSTSHLEELYDCCRATIHRYVKLGVLPPPIVIEGGPHFWLWNSADLPTPVEVILRRPRPGAPRKRGRVAA
jgi:hypothetical protein